MREFKRLLSQFRLEGLSATSLIYGSSRRRHQSALDIDLALNDRVFFRKSVHVYIHLSIVSWDAVPDLLGLTFFGRLSAIA